MENSPSKYFSYMEGKNNINEMNMDIYINNKKIKFNYKYKSNEIGKIKLNLCLLDY